MVDLSHKAKICNNKPKSTAHFKSEPHGKVKEKYRSSTFEDITTCPNNDDGIKNFYQFEKDSIQSISCL